MRIHPINELPSTILLGRQTETGVNEVRLDCAEWLALWPEMDISVWVTPPGSDSAYPAQTHMESDVLVWTVNGADTAVAGSGTMEVLGVADGQRKLSAIATTRVLPSTTIAQGEAPNALPHAIHLFAPAPTDPLMQLVTDPDGKVDWEERLAYKTTKQVENLAETELLSVVDDDMAFFALMTPWAADVVAGAVYTINYNGTDYVCPAIDFNVAFPDGGPPEGVCVLGNLAAMGMEGVAGSNADAPFMMLTIPNAYGEEVNAYCQLIPKIGTTAVTLAVSSVVTTYKTIDPELLDIPAPDMDAAPGERGYIANRPCWMYSPPNGGIVWDGVIEGKEALYMTFNGNTQLLGYKVCPVPMTEHTFVNRLNSWSYAYPYSEDGTSAGKIIINTMEHQTPGLHAIRQNTGNVLYYSYVAENTKGSLWEFSGGTGIYITPEFAATAPRIEWVTGGIYQPLVRDVLPPATMFSTDKNVYYWQWSPNSHVWQPVSTAKLLTDLTCVVNVTVDSTNTVTACDKTYAEVVEAINAGKDVRAVVKNADGSMSVHLRLTMTTGNGGIAFGGTWIAGGGADAAKMAFAFAMNADGTNTYEAGMF